MVLLPLVPLPPMVKGVEQFPIRPLDPLPLTLPPLPALSQEFPASVQPAYPGAYDVQRMVGHSNGELKPGQWERAHWNGVHFEPRGAPVMAWRGLAAPALRPMRELPPAEGLFKVAIIKKGEAPSIAKKHFDGRNWVGLAGNFDVAGWYPLDAR